MIDFFVENLLTMPEAAALCRRPVRTVQRWTTEGVRLGSIRLECLVQGGRILTSREALQRFFSAQTDARRSQRHERTPRQRRTAVDAAKRRLRAKGLLEARA